MAPREWKRLNPRSTTGASAAHFTKASGELSLDGEAKELEWCRSRAIRTAHVVTPELIGYDPEANTLTTRFVEDGQSLYNALWNGTFLLSRIRGKGLDAERVRLLMREIGEWLRLYHDSTTLTDPPEEVVERLEESLESKVSSVRRYGLMDDAFLDKIESYCSNEFARVMDPEYRAANAIRICRAQGDFIASNMLVDSRWNVFVTDFADTHIGVSDEDVGRFCEQMIALAGCGSHRKKRFPPAMEEFLEGYGVSKNHFANPFCRAIIFLNGLISLITEFTTRPYISRQWLTRLELKRLAGATTAWMAHELDARGL